MKITTTIKELAKDIAGERRAFIENYHHNIAVWVNIDTGAIWAECLQIGNGYFGSDIITIGNIIHSNKPSLEIARIAKRIASELPDRPDWDTATENEIIDYRDAMMDASSELSDKVRS